MEHPQLEAGLTVAEVLARWPQTIPVFIRHRLACVGCAIAPFETLAEVATIYNLDPARFLNELRQELALKSSPAGKRGKTMKIAIPSQGTTLAAPMSLRFSRCPFFLFVEIENNRIEALPNPAIGLLEDAGLQAARFVVEHGAQAVIAVMIGPYAQQVLEEAGLTIYEPELPSGHQVIDNLRSGQLPVQDRSKEACL